MCGVRRSTAGLQCLTPYLRIRAALLACSGRSVSVSCEWWTYSPISTSRGLHACMRTRPASLPIGEPYTRYNGTLISCFDRSLPFCALQADFADPYTFCASLVRSTDCLISAFFPVGRPFGTTQYISMRTLEITRVVPIMEPSVHIGDWVTNHGGARACGVYQEAVHLISQPAYGIIAPPPLSLLYKPPFGAQTKCWCHE